jgi:arylsulfatase A-like enzyme
VTGTRTAKLVLLSVGLAACVLGAVLLAFRASYEEVAPAGDGDAPRRVILITVDGLRADRCSLLGYARQTTPQLARLAPLAAVFEAAQAQAPTSLASHASLLTSLDPRASGMRHPGHVLPEAAVTLAEVLRNQGHRTLGFVDGEELSRSAGFAQGFDVFDEGVLPGGGEVNGFVRYGARVGNSLLSLRAEKVFAWIHLRATYGPYLAEDDHLAALAGAPSVVPPGALEYGDPLPYLASLSIHDYLRIERHASFEELLDAYDAAVRRVDAAIGGFLAFLADRDLFHDSLIVIAGVHGESLLDRGLYVGHGLTVFQEEVAVPLVVKFPAGRHAGTRHAGVVRLLDVLPTICAATAAPLPVEAEGADLAALLAEGSASGSPHVATGEAVNLAAKGIDGVSGFTFYVRDGDRKYVAPPRLDLRQWYEDHLHRDRRAVSPPYDFAADPLRLRARVPLGARIFDLASDPSERRDLLAGAPDAEAMEAPWLERAAAAEERHARARERLKAGISEPSRDSEEEIERLFGAGLISADEREQRLEALRAARR